MSVHDTHLTQTGAEVQALLDKIENLAPVPTALSDLADDSTHRVVTDAEKSEWNAKYDKPASGIPASDLAAGVVPENVVKYVQQSLTTEQQVQARTNIGAGTSNFSGSFNDLTNKPDVPENIWKSGTGTDSATTVGGQNEASGTRAVAEGYRTAAKGQEAHSEGRYTSAIGDRSHAEGLGTTANFSVSGSANATTLTTNYVNSLYTGDVICYKSGNDEVYAYIVSVDAQNNTITLNKALSTSALSNANVTKLTGAAIGPRAHSEGYGSEAYGTDSHAEGYFSCALGNQAHAEGGETVAVGQYSHAEGTGSRAKNTAEHAEGMFNVSSDASGEKTIHTVGIGTGDNDRKNAEAILTNGDKYLVGVGSYDGTTFSGASTVQDVINAKYEKPSGGIPASDMASGVIPDAVEANPTVPAGTTPTSLTGLKIGSDYYDIEAGGGTVTDVTVGGTSVVDGNGVAVVPAIPTVNDATLTIKMNNASKGTFSANAASNTEIDLGTVITSHQDISGKADKVTGANNGHFAGLDSNGNLTDSGKSASDFGTYSKPSGGIPKTDLASAVQTSLGKADSALQSSDITGKEDKSNKVSSWSGTTTDDHYPSEKLVKDSLDAKQATISDLSDIRSGAAAGATAYQKPSGGIPSTDLDSAVQTSLGKADTALQSFTETDPTVPSWAKASSKPSYDYSEIGNTPSLATVATSGSYNDLSNTPTIPTVPTDVVKYTAQTLTAEQQAQARTNIGAGTYSKPANGIPASDIAEGAMFVRGNNAIWSGTSITAAGTAAKYATVGNFTASDLAVGVMVVVTFSNTNTAAPNILTLNVAGRGAMPIKRWVNGGLADIDKPENLTGTMAFVYDGTNWVTWYESFDDVDGNCLDAKFGNVTLHQWKPDYTMTDGSYVKGADGLLYEYSGSKYVEIEVGDAERVRFLGIYPKYSSWTNGFAFGKYENDQWVTIESEKFGYDTSQDASITMEYTRAVPSGATHFRTSSASSSLLALEREFYLYLQTGKPAVSQEELEDAVNPTIGTTQPSGGFLPNKVYDLGTLTGTVTFALAAPTDNTRPNPYHWTFDTGSTAPTVNWPANITWLEGSAPTVNASCHYEILIRNGYGTALEFDIS